MMQTGHFTAQHVTSADAKTYAAELGVRFHISPTYFRELEAVKTCDVNVFDS